MNLISRSISEQPANSSVNEQFLLRVGGQPITLVNQLRFPQTLDWAREALQMETWLRENKEAVSQSLHLAVNLHKDDQKLRRGLINLKRNIFNLHLSSNDLRGGYVLAESLAPETRSVVIEWLRTWERYQETLTRGDSILGEELSVRRARLKEIVQLADFRNGILLASPSLDQAIDTYLKADNQKLSRNARTTERSLLEYLFRTTCKTSPFSTLTSVSTGNIHNTEDPAGQAIVTQIDTLHKTSFTRLNLAILSKLILALLENKTINDVLPVQLTSGWRVQGKRIRYLRRRSNIDDYDPEAPIALNVLHEDVLTLPIGPLLRAMLAFMSKRQLATISEIKAHLYNTTGLTETREEINEYVERLVRLHFLIVPALQLDIHSHNPLLTFTEGLHSLNVPLATEVAEILEEVNDRVQNYTTATQRKRRTILNEITEMLRRCYVLLCQTKVILPRTLLYEDTVVRPQQLILSQPKWQDLFTQLGELQSLLPIFDFNTSRKLITRGYFRARYGAGARCDDFLAFADTFKLDFFDQHQKDAMGKEAIDDTGRFTRRQNTFKMPEIERLDDARQVLADYITQQYAHQQPGSPVLRLQKDFLDAIAPYVPEHLKAIQSNAFFTQYVQEDGRPNLIINRVYTGFTLMFSRFAHCFAEEDGHHVIPLLRKRFAELQPEGAVFAELKGGYDATNLNLHPVVTPYELVCPGELSVRPLDEQISLDDLMIRDDTDTHTLRLYSKHLGKEVIPIYLGFLVPMMLPEIQQILLNFAHMSMCPLDLWNGVTHPQNTPDQIMRYPRLLYKDLVLQRAQWQMPLQQFPQRGPDQQDSAYFLAVNRWREEHGIPSRVFFKPVKAPKINDHNEIEDGYEGVSNERKPLYVDFENYFSLQLLESHVKKMKGHIQLTEMLPDQNQLWLKHQDNSYVSELVFEINHASGGHHAKC